MVENDVIVLDEPFDFAYDDEAELLRFVGRLLRPKLPIILRMPPGDAGIGGGSERQASGANSVRISR